MLSCWSFELSRTYVGPGSQNNQIFESQSFAASLARARPYIGRGRAHLPPKQRPPKQEVVAKETRPVSLVSSTSTVILHIDLYAHSPPTGAPRKASRRWTSPSCARMPITTATRRQTSAPWSVLDVFGPWHDLVLLKLICYLLDLGKYA